MSHLSILYKTTVQCYASLHSNFHECITCLGSSILGAKWAQSWRFGCEITDLHSRIEKRNENICCLYQLSFSIPWDKSSKQTVEKKNSNSYWSNHCSKNTYYKKKLITYSFLYKHLKNIISSFNKDLFKFIWKSRSDKINRSRLQDYFSKGGGLKMINIGHFIAIFKSSWIKRITLKQKPWMDLFFAVNGNDVVDRLFHFGDSFPIQFRSVNHSEISD